MAILGPVVKHFMDVFEMEGVLEGPLLTFGYQDIYIDPVRFPLQGVERGDPRVEEFFEARDVKDLFLKRGVSEVVTLDAFDERADIRHDMNLPIPESLNERFASFMDIGSMEHVFDFRQCFENSLRMVRPGGMYFAHLPVRGHTLHGFHVPGPDTLMAGLIVNGFELRFLRLTNPEGMRLSSWRDSVDVMIWIVGRKTRSISNFRIPQQDKATADECKRASEGISW